jgi:hypothetical protein
MYLAFQLFDFGAYLMKVIPETHHAHIQHNSQKKKKDKTTNNELCRIPSFNILGKW